MGDRRSTANRAQKFPRIASLRIALSSSASASRCFSRSFSSSRCFNRLASSMKPVCQGDVDGSVHSSIRAATSTGLAESSWAHLFMRRCPFSYAGSWSQSPNGRSPIQSKRNLNLPNHCVLLPSDCCPAQAAQSTCGGRHGVPSRRIAQQQTSSRRATATIAIFFRDELPLRTCS